MAGHSYAEARKLNVKVLGALLVLTVLTVAAAGVNFGSESINTVVAVIIASIKATLVALFFMHLKYEKPINSIILSIGVVTLALFLGFVLVDIDTRADLRPSNFAPVPGGPRPAMLEGTAVGGGPAIPVAPADTEAAPAEEPAAAPAH
jgi:cytochrome c oxidase subunit IV